MCKKEEVYNQSEMELLKFIERLNCLSSFCFSTLCEALNHAHSFLVFNDVVDWASTGTSPDEMTSVSLTGMCPSIRASSAGLLIQKHCNRKYLEVFFASPFFSAVCIAWADVGVQFYPSYSQLMSSSKHSSRILQSHRIVSADSVWVLDVLFDLQRRRGR